MARFYACTESVGMFARDSRPTSNQSESHRHELEALGKSNQHISSNVVGYLKSINKKARSIPVQYCRTL